MVRCYDGGPGEKRMWFSMIWNISCGAGMRPVSSFDQIGTSLNVISNAPVDMSWPSIALLMKKIIIQAYIFIIQGPIK